MKLFTNLSALFCLIFISQIAFSQEVKTTNEPAAFSIGETRKNSLGMELVYVPAGEFMMGISSAETETTCAEAKKIKLPNCESSIEDEKPEHKVSFKRGFWIGKYEVTQEQWTSLMGTTFRQQRDKAGIAFVSIFGKRKYPIRGEGAKYPIYFVSWKEAKEFIDKINAKNDGFVYSLPSEAEWEYSCRAGTKTVFAFGDFLTSNQGNYVFNGRYIGKTVEVGSYQPNAWGIYDMHGNVGEWCDDSYTDSYLNLPTDGTANLTIRGKMYGEDVRVIRGGSWSSITFAQRSSSRVWNFTNDHFSDTGFRVVARLK